VAVPFQLRQAEPQQVGHLLRRLEPVFRLLGVQAGDDRAQPFGHLRDDLPDRPGHVFRDALEDRQRGRGPERRPAAAHDVEHAAEAEQVRPVVNGLAHGLLRRHVQRRAGDKAALRQAGVVGGAGQAEVGQLDPLLDAGLQQDVARLDVAVDQPHGVRRGQAGGDLPADARHLRHLQRPEPVELLLQRLAGDVLHNEVGGRLLLDGVDVHDVLVADGGGGAGLAQEALAGRRGGGQLRGHDLDGDHPVQPLVERLQHDAEAALAEHLQHLVVAQPAQRAGLAGRLQEAQDVLFPVAVRLALGLVRAQPVVSHRHVFLSFRVRLQGHGAFGLREAGRHLLAGRHVQERAGTLVGRQQRLDPAPQSRVAGTGPAQVGRALGRVGDFQRGEEDRLLGHGAAPPLGTLCQLPLPSVRDFGSNLATNCQEFSPGPPAPSTSRRSQARA
jgi:hypothetical protein